MVPTPRYRSKMFFTLMTFLCFSVHLAPCATGEMTATNPRINDTDKFNSEKNREFKDPFYFVAGADTQLGFISSYLEKAEVTEWTKDLALFDKCIEKINSLRPKPAFFVILGDLCDEMPDQDSQVRSKQEIDFFKTLEKLDKEIPAILLPGNHDVGNTPTPFTLNHYRRVFGKDYYSFFCKGYFFIIVNSQLLHDSSKVENEARDHQVWLENQLQIASKNKGKTIVFMHIPPFITSADEAGGYFSLAEGVRSRFISQLDQAGVKLVLSGHLHKNGGGVWKNLEVVVTTAIGGVLGDDKSGLRIVQLHGDKAAHQYYSFDEVPQTISL